MAMFFDPRRYDLAKVGRYKFNKKLHFNKRIAGHRLAQDVVDPSTGEILAEAGTVVTKELAATFRIAQFHMYGSVRQRERDQSPFQYDG